MCGNTWTILTICCISIKFIHALVDITVDQKLENAGFHRLLATNITIYGNLSSCNLLLEEKMPKNFFIAENELDYINLFSEVHVKLDQKLDVETTASESVPFMAYIYLNKSQPLTTSVEIHSTYVYKIPLRVRYHDPKTEGGFREFKKPPVMLYGRCPQGLNLPKGSVVKLLCNPYSSEVCQWTILSFTQKNLLPSITVPVGNTDDFSYAFVSTHLSAYLGLLYLLCCLFLKR